MVHHFSYLIWVTRWHMNALFRSLILGLGKVWQNLYVCGISLFSYLACVHFWKKSCWTIYCWLCKENLIMADCAQAECVTWFNKILILTLQLSEVEFILLFYDSFKIIFYMMCKRLLQWVRHNPNVEGSATLSHIRLI